MKLSKYTFLFHIDNTEFYIYSTLSNSLIKIDEDSFQLLKKAGKEQRNIASSEVDKEVYDILMQKKNHHRKRY